MLKKFLSVAVLAAATGLSMPLRADVAPASQPDQVSQILTELKTLSSPKHDPNATKEERAAAEAQFYQFAEKYVQVSEDLIGIQSDSPEVQRALSSRWMLLTALDIRNQSSRVMADTEKYLRVNPQTPAAADARYMQAEIKMRKAATPEERIKLIEDLKASTNNSPVVANLLLVAAKTAKDPAEQEGYREQLLKDYPKTMAARMAKASTREKEFAGKPFELKFHDAISGKEISTESLKGKVLVVDFWATWCGPCRMEMPHMKKLYAEYKDQGVEFIGISLDYPDGGLEALREYVAENKIGWPQYFADKDNIAGRWRVAQVPTIFVIDQAGKLVTTEGRGKLEKLLPELLKTAGEKPQTPAAVN